MKPKQYLSLLLGPVLAFSCHLSAAAGSWSSEEVIGGTLETFVYIPATDPALNGKRALMISLHGCIQDNEDLVEAGNWEAVANRYGMVVALPQAEGAGLLGLMGCWDFHTGTRANRNSSDQKYLLELVQALLKRPELNIDPAQVYLTGLSSGAGIANQMWCLAPEVFAGVGVVAGPAPGSEGARADLKSPAVSVEQGRKNCEQFAPTTNRYALQTQLWNTAHGSEDQLVSPLHARRNAEIAAAVYGQQQPVNECGHETFTAGSKKVEANFWCDANGQRISALKLEDMGHAWPSGSKDGFFIDGTHLDYPAWITQWFFVNNRRVQPVKTGSDQTAN